MKPFKYLKPKDVAEATKLYAQNENAFYIAGGTNLLDLMKKEITEPDTIIDITELPLKDITHESNGVRIGALALNSDVAAHPLIKEHAPLVSQALLAGASQQLRNMATISGNILQRTRCPYFYDITFSCNKRNPGGICSARGGFNRTHAIFETNGACVTVHPSDLCVALLAANAQVIVQKNGVEKIFEFKDFHRLPEDDPSYDNNMEKGSLITSIFIPKNNFNKHHYLKIRDRASYSFALVSIGVSLKLNNDVIENISMAAGGVAHKPWKLKEAEAVLKGKKISEALFAQAGATSIKLATPLKHNAYKVKMLQNGIVAALKNAINN